MNHRGLIVVIGTTLALNACLTGVSQTQTPNGGSGDDGGTSMIPDATNSGSPSDMGSPSDSGTSPMDMTVPSDTTPPNDMSVQPTDMTPSDASMPPSDMADAPDMSTAPDMPILPPGVCGNDVVELGETCDDCGDLDCDDQNACTVDEVGGDPMNCLGYCRNTQLFDCIDADGCCPPGCAGADSDCSTTCGDGTVDANETCDGDCPTDCDDGDPATRDLLTGSADECSVACSNVPITRCLDGDGYCPAGCVWATDDDCDADCGNGVIEDDETCDPPSSCSTVCDDGNACTEDTVSGSAATCDVVCSHTEITACVNGDGCCGLNCDASNDDDCSPTCGDRNLDPGETCDGPPECNSITCNQGDACTSTPILTGRHQNCAVQCGYPQIYDCIDSDGCCPPGCTGDTDDDCDASCGNGIVEPGEYCDPPEYCETSCLDDGDVCTTTEYMGDASTCDGRCEYPQITACGPAEGCCPAGCNANNDPDCDPVCGNGVVEDGEICDGNCPSCDDMDACTFDVQQGDPSTCNVICQHTDITQCGPTEGCCPSSPTQCNATNDADCAPICGNDVVEPTETCDGNCPTSCADDADACTDDSLAGSPDMCDVDCPYTTITACGPDEGCCPSSCNANTDPNCDPICGNDVVESGEICDGDCPTACSDGEACTTDELNGSAGSCDAECVFTQITMCTNGDGCCPTGCTVDDDTDC